MIAEKKRVVTKSIDGHAATGNVEMSRDEIIEMLKTLKGFERKLQAKLQA